MIVQGDVFSTKTRKLPFGVKPKEKNRRGFVIAEGEATGLTSDVNSGHQSIHAAN